MTLGMHRSFIDFAVAVCLSSKIVVASWSSATIITVVLAGAVRLCFRPVRESADGNAEAKKSQASALAEVLSPSPSGQGKTAGDDNHRYGEV